MSNENISKIQATVLASQLKKQINQVKESIMDNWDKYGNIKYKTLDENLNKSLAVKKQRLSNYHYLSLG